MAGIVGIYRGIVEDNADPENRGRCRVRILNLHVPDDPVESLPWAEPMQFMGGNNTINYLFVPPIGSTVYIGFINGIKDNPVILGYWRRQSFSINKEVKHFHNQKNHSFLFIKFGEKESSPFIKFDSRTERIEMGTKQNTTIFGSSSHLHSEMGMANLGLEPFQSSFNYKKIFLALSKPALNSLSMSMNGVHVLSSKDYTEETSGSKISIIGSGAKVGQYYIEPSINFLPFFQKSKLLTSIGIKISPIFTSIKNFLKTKLTKIVWRADRSIQENLLFLSKIPGASVSIKNVLNNLIMFSPPIIRETIMTILNMRLTREEAAQIGDKIDASSQGISKNKKEILMPFVNKTSVLGSQQIKITGQKEESIGNDYTITIDGIEQKMNKKNVMWTVQKGFVYKVTNKGIKNIMAAGGNNNFEIVFLDPKSKLRVICGPLNKAPTTKEDVLVKKKAFDDLCSIVGVIYSYLGVHIHNSTAPGAPTTPPVVPMPLPTYRESSAKIAQLFINQKIPVPGSSYFTNSITAT